MTPLRADEFHALADLDDWRYVLASIQAEFTFPSYGTAGTFVAAVASAADRAVHHPDIALRYPGTARVTLRTHAAGAVTSLDVELARSISAMARAADATPGAAGQAVEIAIDTMDADRIRPFWAAVLGYVEADEVTVIDPKRLGPSVWFQTMTEPRLERQRFHLDVSVPHDEADDRVAAALAAGGRLVSAANARSWWILADADGNEACVCTWQDRD
jgi:4a-hydroxytetrahydrobiopterin dehydratase